MNKTENHGSRRPVKLFRRFTAIFANLSNRVKAIASRRIKPRRSGLPPAAAERSVSGIHSRESDPHPPQRIKMKNGAPGNRRFFGASKSAGAARTRSFPSPEGPLRRRRSGGPGVMRTPPGSFATFLKIRKVDDRPTSSTETSSPHGPGTGTNPNESPKGPKGPKGRPIDLRILGPVLACVLSLFYLFLRDTQSFYYDSLVKPVMLMPSNIEPFVWNAVFLCIAVAIFLYCSAKDVKRMDTFLLFASAHILNVLWMFLFYQRQSLTSALFIAVLMSVAVFLVIFRVYDSCKPAAWLYMPCFALCCYTVAMNYMMALVN